MLVCGWLLMQLSIVSLDLYYVYNRRLVAGLARSLTENRVPVDPWLTRGQLYVGCHKCTELDPWARYSLSSDQGAEGCGTRMEKIPLQSWTVFMLYIYVQNWVRAKWESGGLGYHWLLHNLYMYVSIGVKGMLLYHMHEFMPHLEVHQIKGIQKAWNWKLLILPIYCLV